MRINSDFRQRAAVHIAGSDWAASPTPGVERLMLDRVGGEVARATSLVRYAPGTDFPRHVHGGGEEFFVMEGVFRDEHANYPAGTYVRNPPGTSHRPYTDTGCTIFVKLWQFAQDDCVRLVADTLAASPSPAPLRDGVDVLPLFSDGVESVRIERWRPEAQIDLGQAGGVEILCLSGSFLEDSERFDAFDWLRIPEGAAVSATAGEAGCRVLIKDGHLQGNPGPPPAA